MFSLRKWLRKRRRERLRREKFCKEVQELDLQLTRLYYIQEIEQQQISEFLHRRQDRRYVV